MPDYLLDTNILSYWYDTKPDTNGQLKSTHRNVIANVARVRTPDPQTQYVSKLFVSVVTLGEIEYGYRVDPTPDADKQSDYAKFVREQCLVSLELTKHVTEQYGQMKAWLFNHCSPKTLRTRAKRYMQLVDPVNGEELGIQENDLWIAAQAMTHNLVLVTHDRGGNFDKVLTQFSGNMRVEDWAK